MFTILHSSMEWIMAGAVVFTGLMVFGIHIIRGHILSVILGAVVWFFVYSLHKGSTAGIMTATLAALLFDLFGLPILKLFMRK